MAVGPDPRPDPTCDNHWSDYRGALHEHFAVNAARCPEKTCIVESGGHGQPGRSFTYQEIHQASNTLAHYLLDEGIQRGEVVAIYAFRGAETVTAVQGILKAGAAFALIDPAYPVERQILILEVCKARGVIAVARAGVMAEHARRFIRHDLQPRVDLPSFSLHDNASLSSLTCDFSKTRTQATDMPAIVIGPDDTPSITFTSGTTGRPRGVKGRHFSLTYSHAWWQARMSLSETDRFSMLSGIAHDPVHRDMFTPLLLGASLYIPSADDFADLASWMLQNQITFMHVTPAMVQVLLESTAGRQLPCLRVIFTGAERLFKRDCRRLQDLAPNAKIINAYGATETGRSSCFFEMPSRSEDPEFLDRELAEEAIPAGKGMLRSQILVLDKETRQQCDVGATGEIYFRGPGLYEGYLPDEKQLRPHPDKFLTSWFVDYDRWSTQDTRVPDSKEPWHQYYLGPRDRLYRTGDLGRYLPDGNVMCLGRCDDVINIRGYRFELGEIDHHISAHPLTKTHCALQETEGQDLTLYYVPDMQHWREWYAVQQQQAAQANGTAQSNGTTQPTKKLRRRVSAKSDMTIAQLQRIFQPLKDDLRNRLAEKLPSYAVPTRYVPMLRLPLTANGKVDRKALPSSR